MARKLWIATLLCVALGALAALGLTESSRIAGGHRHRPFGLKLAVASASKTSATPFTADVPFPNVATPASLTTDGGSFVPRMEPAAIVVAVESTDETPAPVPREAPPLETPILAAPASGTPPQNAVPTVAAPAAPTNESAPPPAASGNVVLDEISRIRQAVGAVVADLTENPDAPHSANSKDPAAAAPSVPSKASNQFADALARLASQPEPPAEWVDLDGVEPQQPVEERARETLRRTARDLEQLAADLEDAAKFDDADRIRMLSQSLRLQARHMQGVPIHETPRY